MIESYEYKDTDKKEQILSEQIALGKVLISDHTFSNGETALIFSDIKSIDSFTENLIKNKIREIAIEELKKENKLDKDFKDIKIKEKK